MCTYHKRSRARYPAVIIPAMLTALAALLLLPSTGFSEALTLQNALQIALENSPSIRQARNSLESAEASLNAEEASLKSQFRFDLTPFSLVKDRTVDAFTQEWYTAETQSSAARFSVNQRLKWTDARLTLSNNFDWSKTSSELCYSESADRAEGNTRLLRCLSESHEPRYHTRGVSEQAGKL